MTRSSRSTLAVALAAAGLALATGCPSTSDCTLTPEVNDSPSSCSFTPNTDVTVDVRWCNCGAATECEVTLDSGFYLLVPKVNSCDAECPANPDSCGLDSLISCRFVTPSLGEFNTYQVHIVSGDGFEASQFNITASGGDYCGPTT